MAKSTDKSRKRTTTISNNDQHLDESQSLEEVDSNSELGSDEAVEPRLTTIDLLLGIKLDEDDKKAHLTHTYAEKVITDCEDVDPDTYFPVIVESANFHLKGVSLGVDAKPDERNILEIEAECHGKQRQRFAFASLTRGGQEMAMLNLELNTFSGATIHLAHGSGPIHLTGSQEICYNLQTELDKEHPLEMEDKKVVEEEHESMEEENEDAEEEIQKDRKKVPLEKRLKLWKGETGEKNRRLKKKLHEKTTRKRDYLTAYLQSEEESSESGDSEEEVMPVKKPKKEPRDSGKELAAKKRKASSGDVASTLPVIKGKESQKKAVSPAASKGKRPRSNAR